MSKSARAVILRHRKENLKKCSLTGLEEREDLLFFTYPRTMPDQALLENRIVLTIGKEVLTKEDRSRGLFLIDGTWKYAKVMEENTPMPQSIVKRSLPSGIKTAYPRKQEDCPDPESGLASVEALAIAYAILGWEWEPLLDNYYWKKEFIFKNLTFFDSF